MKEKESTTKTKPITRSELRKQRKKMAKVKPTKSEETAAPYYPVEPEEKKAKQFFRREKKKNQPLTTSRSEEQEKTAALGRFLNKAILGVTVLLVIVFIAIFYF